MKIVSKNQTQEQSVSFTVNACVTDVDYIEPMLRHMMRTLDYPFLERAVAMDVSQPTLSYGERVRGKQEDLVRIVSRLLDNGTIDRVDEILWDEANRKRIIYKYFGRQKVEEVFLKDYKGAPIYQYLYALDQCKGDYVLHVDADILFYSAAKYSWIDEGIQLMCENPRIIVVTPSHPPKAHNFLEYLVGHPLRRNTQEQWHRASSMSTRYFLWNRKRIEENLLPLEQNVSGESLENTLTHTMKQKGYWRYSLNGHDSWAIHPMPHNDLYIKHLDELIWAAEHNVYPFRRRGRYPWDLYTHAKHIQPWLREVRRAKRRSKSTRG